MKRCYKLYQVDAFTMEKFKGNPAGVVMHADGLSEAEMQSIARELNNSETAFLFESSSSEYDVHTRYFTPTSEVPICGHATIASQYVRAIENRMDQGLIYNKTGAGILPVEISKIDAHLKVTMTQGQITFGLILESDLRSRLLSALGIGEGDMLENAKIQVVSTGHSKVMIGIKSVALLNKLNPDMGKLKQISSEIACNGFYVFSLNTLDTDPLVQGRMFAPAIGIQEDPVTGNANGPLGAYLVHYKMVDSSGDLVKFKALQGEAMQRSGVIDVEVALEKGEPVLVKVSGTATIAFETEIEL